MSHTYSLFGLTLASELECPELVRVREGSVADIYIALGPIAAIIENPMYVHPRFQVGDSVYQFHIDDVARYRIERGQRITVAPFTGAREEDVRLFLLGMAMAAILHQRGRVPLHVCAVAVDGGAHAFCGESGAGKSTLAAALHRRGLPILCDDVGVAVPDGNGTVRFFPGFPRIKLWQDALDHFGIDPAPLDRDLSRTDKYHLRLRDAFHGEPLPLRRLYQLKRTQERNIPAIQPLARQEAIGLLIENTYRPRMVRRIGNVQSHLRQCGQIASAIHAYRYTRAWSLEQLDVSLDRLLEHLRRGDG